MSRQVSLLRFSQYYGAGKGFAAANIDRERVTDETVIRELVQNALDASKGDEVEVTVRCENVKLRSIPHIPDYRKAFAKAKKYRAGKGGPPEKNAIERIEKRLKASEIKVLVCIDNGKGIDNEALRALYGEADTTKVDRGRGSVGVGHLTAFAASDLRYVLYAGRHTPDAFGEFTFGGQVILAVHREGDKQYDASGFIISDENDENLFIRQLTSAILRWRATSQTPRIKRGVRRRKERVKAEEEMRGEAEVKVEEEARREKEERGEERGVLGRGPEPSQPRPGAESLRGGVVREESE